MVSSTQITTTVPAGATTGKISVTTPGGKVSSANSFTVVPAPSISSFSPTAGPVNTKVSIVGTGFSGTPKVQFNGVASTSVSLVSSTQVTATVPAGATSGPITLTTAGGTATSPSSFNVLPLISGFTPTSGGVGTAVTISGTSFTGITRVAFNGVSAPFTVISNASVVTGVPAGAASGKISVTTSSGTSASSSNFTVGTKSVAPVISSFSPTSGPAGTLVTVTGTNLGGATSVKMGGVNVSFSVLAAGKLTFQIPSGVASGKISVTTAGGTGSSSSSFTVL